MNLMRTRLKTTEKHYNSRNLTGEIKCCGVTIWVENWLKRDHSLPRDVKLKVVQYLEAPACTNCFEMGSYNRSTKVLVT